MYHSSYKRFESEESAKVSMHTAGDVYKGVLCTKTTCLKKTRGASGPLAGQRKLSACSARSLIGMPAAVTSPNPCTCHFSFPPRRTHCIAANF